ncbi:hypothetical protein AAG570_005784 [Ranatra chinensis]|uniref:Uncharacterized protein n=1 Tax=Ranatra chinensis TaxID=642074 RepID=A0ABD0XYF3_9HEMI
MRVATLRAVAEGVRLEQAAEDSILEAAAEAMEEEPGPERIQHLEEIQELLKRDRRAVETLSNLVGHPGASATLTASVGAGLPPLPLPAQPPPPSAPAPAPAAGAGASAGSDSGSILGLVGPLLGSSSGGGNGENNNGGGSDSGSVLGLVTPLLGTSSSSSGNGGDENAGGSDSGSILSLAGPLLGSSSGGPGNSAFGFEQRASEFARPTADARFVRSSSSSLNIAAEIHRQLPKTYGADKIDLAPSDFNLIANPKEFLSGKRFSNDEEIGGQWRSGFLGWSSAYSMRALKSWCPGRTSSIENNGEDGGDSNGGSNSGSVLSLLGPLLSSSGGDGAGASASVNLGGVDSGAILNLLGSSLGGGGGGGGYGSALSGILGLSSASKSTGAHTALGGLNLKGQLKGAKIAFVGDKIQLLMRLKFGLLTKMINGITSLVEAKLPTHEFTDVHKLQYPA